MSQSVPNDVEKVKQTQLHCKELVLEFSRKNEVWSFWQIGFIIRVNNKIKIKYYNSIYAMITKHIKRE